MKVIDQASEVRGSFFETLGCGIGLLHQGSILLRHLVELVHRLSDFGDARTLLSRRGGDLRDDVGHALDAGDDVSHGRTCRVDQFCA